MAEYGFGPAGIGFWHGATPLARGLGRLVWDLEVRGTEHLPAGAKVVAANHYSHIDPVVLGIPLGPVRFLAVDELYGTWGWFDGVITWLGAIPLTRTRVPFGAMKEALATLEAGGTIGMFPEGRRVWTWGEVVPKRGAAWLAQRAGVPLIPIAIEGSDGSMGRESLRLRRWPVRVAIAEAIDPAAYAPDKAGTLHMMAEWERRVGAALAGLQRR